MEIWEWIVVVSVLCIAVGVTVYFLYDYYSREEEKEQKYFEKEISVSSPSDIMMTKCGSSAIFHICSDPHLFSSIVVR